MSLNHLSETSEKTWLNIGCENLSVYGKFLLLNQNISGVLRNTPLVLSADLSTLVFEPGNKTVGGFGTLIMDPTTSPLTITITNVLPGTLISNSGIGGSSGTSSFDMVLGSSGLQSNYDLITSYMYNIGVSFSSAAGSVVNVYCAVSGVIQPTSNYVTSNGLHQTLSLSGIADLGPGNSLQIYLISSVSQTFQIFSWQICAHRL